MAPQNPQSPLVQKIAIPVGVAIVGISTVVGIALGALIITACWRGIEWLLSGGC